MLLRPILTTPRLTLRPFGERDLDNFHDYYAHPAVGRFNDFRYGPREDSRAPLGARISQDCLLGPGDTLCLAIENAYGLVIGEVTAVLDEPATADITVAVARTRQHHGYGREAVSALLTLVFNHGIAEVATARVDPRDLRAAKLCRALGLERVELAREVARRDGDWYDEYRFRTDAAAWARLHPDLDAAS